jgi:hypothetical protein
MTRYQDIGLAFVQTVLLAVLTSRLAEMPHSVDRHPNPSIAPVEALRNNAPSLPPDHRVRWQETEARGPRCFTTHLPAPGTWWIEATVSAPTTAPELVVFGGDLSLVERVHGLLLEVHRAGNYVVCLTSQAPLGDVELGSSFLSEVAGKSGDADVIEPDPEP